MTRDGWWHKAKSLPSPNFDSRPPEGTIDLLVIHNISLPPREYGGGFVQQLFLNQLDPSGHPYFQSICTLKVSSHAYIDRLGEVTQFVSFNDRAWHAGESLFCGRAGCNDFSIGIELEGTDDEDYTPVQYQQLVELSAVIMNTYPAINLDRIVGHSDIAPGRKTDPGNAFDWRYYKTTLTNYLAGEV